jgi:hypothetical protein
MEIGVDLALSTVVGAMVRSAKSWDAVASFCEHVMMQKEAAERRREEDPHAAPNQRRRLG